MEPRHIRVPLPGRLHTMRFVLGTVNHVDPARKVVNWADPEGASGEAGYDRLILTAGSVNKLLPTASVLTRAYQLSVMSGTGCRGWPTGR